MILENCSIPMKSNVTFDYFIVYKNKYTKNAYNQKQINMSEDKNILLSFLAINFTHETGLPIPINLEDFKIYAEEKKNTNNVLKDKYYQYLFNAFEQNPECTFNYAFDVVIMLLGSSPFSFIYNDIKNNYINQLVLKQFIKAKDKCVDSDEKTYKIATMDFRDFNC